MSRVSDRYRILRLLRGTEGLSNSRIKTELDLPDERYSDVRDSLIDEGLVEKYQCYGGGVRLTRRGERESPDYDGVSTAENEAALYKPMVAFLEKEADEDGVEAVICATHGLRARGQWQNPDVTRVAIEQYRHLRKARVTVTTYEVKQFPRWTTEVVFEAASHLASRMKPTLYLSGEVMRTSSLSPTQPTGLIRSPVSVSDLVLGLRP